MTNAIFDGTNHELDARRLTLVFNKSHGESRYPGRVEITPESALAHFGAMGEPCDVAQALFLMVVDDFGLYDGRKPTKADLSACQPCFRQLIALFDLSVRLTIAGTPFVWKYPEMNLHPRYQANLADAAIAFSDARLMKSIMAQHLHKCSTDPSEANTRRPER